MRSNQYIVFLRNSELSALTAFLALFLFVWDSTAQTQPQVIYQATDLTDTTVGEDLWQFSYSIAAVDFSVDQGWTAFFAPTIYRNLVALPSPNGADWDVLAVQPDEGLNAPGFYDAQALRAAPSLEAIFRVTFIWLGQGVPGIQPFTFYNSDFSTRSSGATSLELTLLTSGVIDGPFLKETNAVWNVPNKTFALAKTSTNLFFRIVGGGATRITAVRVVGTQIVVQYELIQTAQHLPASNITPHSWRESRLMATRGHFRIPVADRSGSRHRVLREAMHPIVKCYAWA